MKNIKQLQSIQIVCIILIFFYIISVGKTLIAFLEMGNGVKDKDG